MKDVQLTVTFSISVADDEDINDLLMDIPIKGIKIKKWVNGNELKEVSFDFGEYDTIGVNLL